MPSQGISPSQILAWNHHRNPETLAPTPFPPPLRLRQVTEVWPTPPIQSNTTQTIPTPPPKTTAPKPPTHPALALSLAVLVTAVQHCAGPQARQTDTTAASSRPEHVRCLGEHR